MEPQKKGFGNNMLGSMHTRTASTQRQHFGRSCTKPNSQHADNSSAHALEVIFLEIEIVPLQNLMPSLPGDLLGHICQHQHPPFGSLKHH